MYICKWKLAPGYAHPSEICSQANLLDLFEPVTVVISILNAVVGVKDL